MFRQDGSGSSGVDRADESTFDWRVNESHLKLIYGRQPGLYGLFDRARNQLGFPSMMYEGQQYLIREIAADRMVLQLVSPGQRITAESNDPFELRREQ